MTSTNTEPAYWSVPKKVALRFAFIFFLLYVFLESNGVIPETHLGQTLYVEPVQKIVIWMGAHLLHLAKPVEYNQTGSGDTLHDYITYLFILIVAVVGALIWSVVDRKARNYNKLFYWLTVIVRYYLAITMVSYGLIKIIKLQFPGPSPDRLIQPLGTFSPMGLAWTYMGFSTGFNLFTGLGELTCGLLLFFRRTATMGALLGVVVAANIMAVNFFFDVPVKLLSTMLVIMSLFVLSKDGVRLLNFFLLNKPAPPANLSDHRFAKRWKNISLTVVKYVLIVYVVGGNLYGDLQGMRQYGDQAPKPPLYGLYDVKSFVRNRDTVAPLQTDTLRWKKLAISYSGSAKLAAMNDSIKWYAFVIDTAKQTIKMTRYGTPADSADFTYRVHNDMLLLKGKMRGDSVDINLKKFNLQNFRLLNRGFHWVNEQAYNK